jgi:hypothetical protein
VLQESQEYPCPETQFFFQKHQEGELESIPSIISTKKNQGSAREKNIFSSSVTNPPEAQKR